MCCLMKNKNQTVVKLKKLQLNVGMEHHAMKSLEKLVPNKTY